MSMEAYTTPDWTKRFINHQVVNEDYYNIYNNSAYNEVYGQRYFNESKYAFGNGLPAYTTKLLIVYLAGLYYARKQLMPGFLYFRNTSFNWVGSLKFLAMGYAFGSLLSIFAFGNPYLVEDYVRRKFRQFTAPTFFEASAYKT